MSKPSADFPIRDNRAEHRFEADLGDSQTAIAEYRVEGARITFTHTSVPPEFEGHGVGSALVRFALDSAREHNQRVLPACAFFAQYMRQHEDVQELIDPEYRAEMGL